MTTGEEILGVIEQFRSEMGFSPSVREMADAVERSPSVVFYWLNKLESKGKVQREKGKPRTVRRVP